MDNFEPPFDSSFCQPPGQIKMMKKPPLEKFAWKTMKHEIYECAFLMPLPTVVADFCSFCFFFCVIPLQPLFVTVCCLMHIISRDENLIGKKYVNIAIGWED